MRKQIEIDKDLYNARIMVDGYRVFRITDSAVFVEVYLDRPSVSPSDFWEHYAYSGEADKWFPRLVPSTIVYKTSPGQYDIGTDVRAYGKLRGTNKPLVAKIRAHMKDRAKILKEVSRLNKQIKDLEKVRGNLNQKTYSLRLTSSE